MRLITLIAFLVLSSTRSMGAAADDPAVQTFEQSEVEQFRVFIRNMDQDALAVKVDASLAKMISIASHKLRQKGYRSDAKALEDKYHRHYAGLLLAIVANHKNMHFKEIGDYAPMSEFLTKTYDMLLEKLGPEIMAITHLEDIKVINYAIPCVFHFDSIPDYAISPAEYKKHFVPLCGVVAFWGVSIACDVGTWGTGYWLICTPAGMLAKYAVVEYIAPPMSPNWYDYFYPPEL